MNEKSGAGARGAQSQAEAERGAGGAGPGPAQCAGRGRGPRRTARRAPWAPRKWPGRPGARGGRAPGTPARPRVRREARPSPAPPSGLPGPPGQFSFLMGTRANPQGAPRRGPRATSAALGGGFRSFRCKAASPGGPAGPGARPPSRAPSRGWPVPSPSFREGLARESPGRPAPPPPMSLPLGCRGFPVSDWGASGVQFPAAEPALSALGLRRPGGLGDAGGRAPAAPHAPVQARAGGAPRVCPSRAVQTPRGLASGLRSARGHERAARPRPRDQQTPRPPSPPARMRGVGGPGPGRCLSSFGLGTPFPVAFPRPPPSPPPPHLRRARRRRPGGCAEAAARRRGWLLSLVI